MHRSYVPKVWIDAFIENQHEFLPKPVETRFFSVLRVKPNEEVAVFDGEGRQVIGVLKKDTVFMRTHFLRARLVVKEKPTPEIVVVQSAIDEAKLTHTLQRGVEFGVDKFIIFPSIRSDRFCFAKLQKRYERLVRIAEDAARQSERFFIPKIHFAKDLDEVMSIIAKDPGFAIFGDAASTAHLSHLLEQHSSNDQPCYIAVGPEGGFSPDEKDKLLTSRFTGVRWAPYVLRTELALLAPLAILNAHLGRA